MTNYSIDQETKMHGMRALRFVGFALLAIVAIAAAGYVVMALWNWLIPSLIGWHALSFAQALGLLLLSRLLFGGLRPRSGGWRHRRWRHMSDEERERFREEMRWRCGQGAAPEKPA
jgi:hypothetical protein